MILIHPSTTHQPDADADTMFTLFQKIMPKHLLSRVIGRLAESEIGFVKNTFIGVISWYFNIDLSEAERTNRRDYRTYNDFFTRTLRPGLRPINGRISSPADGTVAALGQIDGDTLIQSKNHSYSMATLLADSTDVFSEGSFITIYLAPHNYHRVHVPQTAELHSTCYIPGELFSVNQNTADNLPDLFARNERLVCRFRTGEGPMATILVGAMLVAGIKPVWLDKPYKPRIEVATELKRIFKQGDELGQFQMGSTVILLFNRVIDFKVKEGETVRVGQALTD